MLRATDRFKIGETQRSSTLLNRSSFVVLSGALIQYLFPSHQEQTNWSDSMPQNSLDEITFERALVNRLPTNGIAAPLNLDPGNNDSGSNGDGTDDNNLCGQLCTSCARLDLSASRFIIDNTPSDAVNEVRNYYLRKSRFVTPTEAYPASTTFRLGTLSELKRSALQCSFCALVKKALPQDVQDNSTINQRNDEHASPDPLLTATWEIDGRARVKYDGLESRTRRLHLRWSDKDLGDAYVVFMPLERYTRPASDAPTVNRSDALFLGRTIVSTGKNRALMKSWLDLCRNKHGGPCDERPDLPDRFFQMLNSSYFGVIDVHNLQLTSLPYGRSGCEPYAALSYVWGDGDNYKTVLDNVMAHRMHGGLEAVVHELPQAIQDAIALVPTLGIRYLWVDSLCIVQDSTRSWKLNAFNMDLIYGHATVTICAADGQDASKGLRAMHWDKHNSSQHTAEIQRGFRVMLTRPPEAAIRSTTWNLRAWTFQERLLSPRTLIFVDGRVYFQCRSTGMSEDIVADQEGAGWSLDLVNAPLQILRQVNKKPFWVYMKAVELYTRRQMKYKADILAAFSGVYRLLEITMECPFVFGLPTAYFDLALLWQAEKAAIRRKIPRDEALKRPESEREFPSWAWCGWDESPMVYDSATLHGVLRDEIAWLKSRTWIVWYVRDGHGDLRPLEERNVRGSSSSTEEGSRRYNTVKKDHIVVRHRGDGLPEPPRDRMLYVEHPDNFPYVTSDDYNYSQDAVLARRQERRNQISTATGDSFRRTLREFPYQVDAKEYFDANLDTMEHPLKPILQFYTYHKYLNLIPHVDSSYIGPQKSTPEPELQRYSIVDDSGDWCGSIVLDSSWVNRQQRHSRLRHEFIAISEAMRFTKKECPTWTYYIPKEREDSEWDLYFVLLIEFEVDMWKRIGLGKVFQEAFAKAEVKEIILG